MLSTRTARGLKALSINYDGVLVEAYVREQKEEIEMGEHFYREHITRYLDNVRKTNNLTLNV